MLIPKLFRHDNASIKGQCKKHNFHGADDKLEKDLCDFEDKLAPIFAATIENRSLPDAADERILKMLEFFVVQRSRTVVAAEAHAAASNFFLNLLHGHVDDQNEFIRGLKFDAQYPAILPIQSARQKAREIRGYRVCLLVNETDEKFITSDNPVIPYNQYCEGIYDHGVLGWECSGFQAILPISPEISLVAFDPDTYVSSCDISEPVKVTKSDVRKLNELQILNAHSLIYFRSENSARTVHHLVDQIRSRRPTFRINFSTLVPVNGSGNEIIHYYEPMLRFELKLSFLSVRKRASAIPKDARANLIRGRPYSAPARNAQRHRPDGAWYRRADD